MKTLSVLGLMALIASCHFDKLLSGGGGGPQRSHGTPVGLAFNTHPGPAQAGQPLNPVRVAVVDSAGTPVAGADSGITIALGANPGSATLSGTNTAQAVNGVATFTGLQIDKPSNGYTLRASAGLLAAESDAFDVMPPPPTTGDLTVTTTTGGTGTDPDGYTVTVDGASQAIAINDTRTFTGLSAGNHSVGLSDVASNCVVSGQNPRTVAVSAGSTAQTNFAVTCTAPANQPPIVTAGPDQSVAVGLLFTLNGASFSDPDHDGPWSVTIDWGDGSSPTTFGTPSEGSIGGSHAYPVALLTRDYPVTVTVEDARGGRNSATKTVTVLVL